MEFPHGDGQQVGKLGRHQRAHEMESSQVEYFLIACGIVAFIEDQSDVFTVSR